jgi:DNA-binding NtrC family response regulator
MEPTLKQILWADDEIQLLQPYILFLRDKGYEVTSAKVSYTLAWKPKDSDMECAVCLANMFLPKIDNNIE